MSGAAQKQAEPVAVRDHKLGYMMARCRGKSVLDLGCVQHDPGNARSRFWLHRALRKVAEELVGLDSDAVGVATLARQGYDIRLGDACDFDLGRTFEVIVAGDLIEHLDNHAGFLASCRRHMTQDSRLLIATPNPWYWRHLFKAVLGPEVRNHPEHTCWLCPRTFRQLADRHGFAVEEVVFGSRYRRDRWMPLPRGLKHTSWQATVRPVER